MTFWQDENRVSAEYMFDGGIITGTLSGDTLRGWWREHDNAKECGPDSTWCGPLLFKFSPDGKSFTGSWGYCGTIPSTLDPEGGGWTGTIKESVVSYTQEECEEAGRFWCSGECNLAPCDSEITEETCELSGRFWCSDTCTMIPCNAASIKKPSRHPAANVKKGFTSIKLTGTQFDLWGRRLSGNAHGINIHVDATGRSRAIVSIVH